MDEGGLFVGALERALLAMGWRDAAKIHWQQLIEAEKELSKRPPGLAAAEAVEAIAVSGGGPAEQETRRL